MSTTLTVDSIRHNKEKIKELINFFSKTIEENRCAEEIVNVFHKISYYTQDFFINEELLMKKYEIPSFSEHVNEHRVFAEKMIFFQNEFEQGKPELCEDLLSYLKQWYEKHMLYSDEKIIEYINVK